METAICINNVSGELEGIRSENEYLSQKLGEKNQDWRKIKQKLIVKPNGSRYDAITVELKDRTQKTFYFDITSFFGMDSPDADTLIWHYHKLLSLCSHHNLS